MNNEVLYGIALSLLKGVGDSNAKVMLSYAGSAEKLFKLSSLKLQKISGIGPRSAEAFKDTKDAIKRAEQEIRFIEKNKIDILFYYDKRYPKRLLNCADAPLYIFSKGKVDYNKERFISVVGTRHATEYGKEMTDALLAELSDYNVSLVSGLAFGIDICAHKAALKYDIPNIAVLAHGLDRLYPSQHKNIAEKLQENGALLTDYLSETNPDRQNFPNRNRIVAGMTDATIVVESAVSGGALITAEIANSYNRDVFAFPGKTTDTFSEGCLKLIKQHKAQLICNARDIIETMNWEINSTEQKSIQPSLFIELNQQEQLVYDLLKVNEKLHIDKISAELPLTPSTLSGILLQLEMQGIIYALPGKMYKLNT